MSRIIKSEQCIEALPRQLGPADEDAFFISEEFGQADLNIADLRTFREPSETGDENLTVGAALTAAQMEREEIVKAATAAAEKLKAEAYRAGVEKGREEGLELARQELAAHLDKALAALKEIEALRQTRIKESESEILKLSGAIAAKIIGEEIRLDPEEQLEIIRQALGKITGSAKIVIKVHPDLAETVTAAADRLAKFAAEPVTITVEADNYLEPGDCYIETEQGQIDARIQKQLEVILDEFLKTERSDE